MWHYLEVSIKARNHADIRILLAGGTGLETEEMMNQSPETLGIYIV